MEELRQGYLLADGVLDEKGIGGDAKNYVTGPRVGVKESDVLPENRLQVLTAERAGLPLPSVHPACNFCEQIIEGKTVKHDPV